MVVMIEAEESQVVAVFIMSLVLLKMGGELLCL